MHAREIVRSLRAVSLLLLPLAATLAACNANTQPSRHLLIVVDGLRPDNITPEIMPNLYAIGRRGVVFERHHSVYPTVTRVNAASISTGSYPERHGLLGNAVFFPRVETTRFLDTGDRANLLKISGAVGGRLLTTTTLADTLQAAGQRVLVVSAGSTGSSFLLNHTVAGGAILHYAYTLPVTLDARVRAVLGPSPEAGTPSDALNQRAVDAFLEVGIPDIDPSVTLMWLTDPDTTAHRHGLGSTITVESLRAVDRQIGRVEDGLERAGLADIYNIWVTSDHGFSTHTAAPDIEAMLARVAGERADGSPTIVAGEGAIYVRDGRRDVVQRIVEELQHTEGVGAIFTQPDAPESLEGWVPGTLSFDAARWRHDRSADILFSPDWTAAPNDQGVPGTTSSGGIAGHGSSSPFDIHNPLMAAGPDIRQRTVISTASGNVDFAPTFLRMLGLDVPPTMQGRVLLEALDNEGQPTALSMSAADQTVEASDGSYELKAFFSTVESEGRSYRYLDRTEVRRPPR